MKMDAVTGTPLAGERKISAVRTLKELETHLVSRFQLAAKFSNLGDPLTIVLL